MRRGSQRLGKKPETKRRLAELHQHKREERADRIVRLLAAIEAVPELQGSSYGWLALTAETLNCSKAAASRDFHLARRVHAQFTRMFGQQFDVKKDQLVGSWDWSPLWIPNARKLPRQVSGKPSATFPFGTRLQPSEKAFCGFGIHS